MEKKRYTIVNPFTGAYVADKNGAVRWTTDLAQANRLAQGIGYAVDAQEFCTNPQKVMDDLRRELLSCL